MKKTIFLLIIAIAITLTGCSETTKKAEAQNPMPVSGSTPEPTPTPEIVFVRVEFGNVSFEVPDFFDIKEESNSITASYMMDENNSPQKTLINLTILDDVKSVYDRDGEDMLLADICDNLDEGTIIDKFGKRAIFFRKDTMDFYIFVVNGKNLSALTIGYMESNDFVDYIIDSVKISETTKFYIETSNIPDFGRMFGTKEIVKDLDDPKFIIYYYSMDSITSDQIFKYGEALEQHGYKFIGDLGFDNTVAFTNDNQSVILNHENGFMRIMITKE